MVILKSNKSLFFIYSVLSGVLLSLPWTSYISGILLLFAFYPLLIIEDYYFKNKYQTYSINFFYYCNIAFLCWNLLATWWIGKATVIGLIAAITTNTFLMSVVFYAFHKLSFPYKK